MAQYKLCISDPSTGRTFQKEVKDNFARPFIGLNLGETMKGDSIEINGYEFEITGGADYCGFPMRKDIEGPVRKQVLITTGVGTRNREAGIRLRRTVCGNTIHERITQVSMKILKHGKTPLGGAPAAEGEAPAEKPAEEPKKKEKPKKEEKPKEHSKEEKKAAPKEEKPAEKKAE